MVLNRYSSEERIDQKFLRILQLFHATLPFLVLFGIVSALRPDFTSGLVHGLAFGTPKFYIAPYGKIKHGLVSLSSNYDVKSGLSAFIMSI